MAFSRYNLAPDRIETLFILAILIFVRCDSGSSADA